MNKNFGKSKDLLIHRFKQLFNKDWCELQSIFFNKNKPIMCISLSKYIILYYRFISKEWILH